MKRTKTLKAKPINDARSWIIPELIKGDKEDTYCIKIRNGTGIATNFSIKSNLVTDDFSFVLDGGLNDIWEAELNNVSHEPGISQCLVKPASLKETLDIHILRIRHKLSFDTKWRSSRETHQIRF